MRGDARTLPVYCYDYSVKNHQDREVLKIHWKVANFFRKSIPAGCLRSDCPPIAGLRSEYAQEGPLHYGPSNNPYSTSVYTPSQKRADASISDATVASPGEKELAILASHVHVDVEGRNVESKLSDVMIISEFEDHADGRMLKYEFINGGENFISLHLNLSKDAEFSDYFVYNFEKPLSLSGFEKVVVNVPTSSAVVPEAVSVVIWDEVGDVAAIGTDGVYAVQWGERDIDEEQIWDLVTSDQ